MSFTSQVFLVFIGLFFVLHLLTLKNKQVNNVITLIASYIFYGWWDWRFLSLLIISSYIDYYCALNLEPETRQEKRRLWLFLSIGSNLTILGFFKYFSFFYTSAQALLDSIGVTISPLTLQIVLPVGISFYTFQSLSYTIDVYKGKLRPTRSLIEFLTFVAFFPQLVAGPIERATHLLPQFSRCREFNLQLATDGFRQILWGFFKKMVIADNLAMFVDPVYANPQNYSGPQLFVATVFFGFQIYCDFSAYSDIAIGLGKILGVEINMNFRSPYLSRNIQEFWRRWHISLNTWFRDYIYTPLGGSHASRFLTLRNIFIVFMISGLWHGAKWTYVLWGLYHAIVYIGYVLIAPTLHIWTVRFNQIAVQSCSILITFITVISGWVLFRAESLQDAIYIYGHMFSIFDSKKTVFTNFNLTMTVLIILLLVVEFLSRRHDHPLKLERLPAPARWSIYLSMLFVFAIFGANNKQAFIYFQF